MRIHTSSLWKEPRIIFTILRNAFVLDPTVLVHNPQVAFFKDQRKIIAFCALVNHTDCKELKAVYTLPSYRKKRYSSQLVQKVLSKQKRTYLVCKKELIHFYKRFGFKTITKAPFPLRWRARFYNTVVSPLFGSTLVIMQYHD